MITLSRLPFRVGLFHTIGNAATIASLAGGIELLAENGFLVDLFHQESDKYAEVVFDHPLVSVHSLGYRRKRKGWQRWVPERVMEILSVTPRHLVHPYVGLIGVDPSGLILASRHAQRLRLPTIYWSTEILHSSMVKNDEFLKRRKTLEKHLSKDAELVIVQDQIRAQLLVEDNDLDPARVILAPNAPKGAARRCKSNYWYQTLGISPDYSIALHLGPLSEWRMSQELVDSVQYWPPNWVLVMHLASYYQKGTYRQAVIESADPKRVFFSQEPVPRTQLGELVDGADVGIALYAPQSVINIHEMGWSSGKLLEYMRRGLPVIVAPRHERFINKQRGGIVVSLPDEIGEALREIESDYDTYSSNVCSFFNQELQLDLSFQPVIDWFNAEAQRRWQTRRSIIRVKKSVRLT